VASFVQILYLVRRGEIGFVSQTASDSRRFSLIRPHIEGSTRSNAFLTDFPDLEGLRIFLIPGSHGDEGFQEGLSGID
jgi:hypothetical protein